MPPYLTLANRHKATTAKGKGFEKGHVVHDYSRFSGVSLKVGFSHCGQAHEL